MIFDSDLFSEFFSFGESVTHDSNKHVKIDDYDDDRGEEVDQIKVHWHWGLSKIEASSSFCLTQHDGNHEPDASTNCVIWKKVVINF